MRHWQKRVKKACIRSVWSQNTIDISLQGLTTDHPGDWDAQYNEPFTVIIKLDDGRKLELTAYLQNVEDNHLGFSLGHLDIQSKETMRQLLAPHMESARLDWELTGRGLEILFF